MAAADVLRLKAQLDPFLKLAETLAPADPLRNQLRSRIDELEPFLSGNPPAGSTVADALSARDALLTALKAFLDHWKGEIVRLLLGGLPELPGLRDALSQADWLSPDGIQVQAEIGPLMLRAGLGAVVVPIETHALPGGGALEAVPLGPARIDQVSATLAGPFPGTGALRVFDEGCTGALRMPLGPVTVDALASLRRTPGGGPSFLGVLGVGFTPAIQLGFGFAMDRIGGIVGMARRVDLDALSQGIRSGAATDVLFGAPGGDDARRLVAVDRLFPPQSGRHVVGPMFGLAWLSAGAGLSLVHADLAVLVQFGGPVTVALVGQGRLALSELLRIRADLAGSFDAARGRVGLDVSIVEARVLGAFRLAGDAAFRLAIGDNAGVVFSAGGFYPGFDPRPVELGPLRRLSFGTDIPTPGLEIRVEGYFATTSNTLQLGGRLDVLFDAAAIVARGGIGMDALVQLRPFHFHAEVSGELSVEFLGETFCGVRVDAGIDGPGPMSVNARLTVETFLKDFPWHETFTFGHGDADRAGRATSLLTVVADAARDAPLLHSAAVEDREVVLEPRNATDPRIVLSPRGELSWVQRVSPLDIRCDRLQGEPLLPPGQSVHADVLAPALRTGEVREPFAPGAFLNLPENLALQVPAFEPQALGLRIGFAAQPEQPVPQPPPVDVVIIRMRSGGELVARLVTQPLALGWVRTVADMGLAAPRVWSDKPAVSTRPEAWHTADGAAHDTASAAWQHARHAGGGLRDMPIHQADPVLDITGV